MAGTSRRSFAGPAAVAVALTAAFLAPALASGARLPTGPDAPLYAWWTNLAAGEGLAAIPGRIGTLALSTSLDAVTPGDALAAVAVAGPLLAIVVGLAAGGVAATCIPDRSAAVATATFAGAWAGILAPSWLASLTASACALAGFAMLVSARGSRARLLAGALAIAASTLSHAGLLPLIAAIAAAAAVAWWRIAGRGGVAPAIGLLGGVVAGGAAGLGAVVALAAGAQPVPGDTSQDAFLRRAGLRGILADRFRERVAADARRAALPGIAGAALGGAGIRNEPRDVAESGYRALWLGWGIVTILGVTALAIVPRAQGNRLVALAYFVPLAAGPGFVALRRRAAWVAALGAAVLIGGSLYAWYRQPAYVGPHEIRLARTVDAAIAGLPPGTPVVILADTRDEAAAFHAMRGMNVVRSQVAPGRQRDLHLAVASPADLLRGRPTRTGDAEHDALSTRTLAAVPRRRAAVIVLRAFNRPGYAEAVEIGTPVADGVVSIGEVRLPETVLAGNEPVGIAPPARAAAILASLLVLAVVGGGWSRRLAGSGVAGLMLAPAGGVVTIAVAGGAAAAAGTPAWTAWVLAAVLGGTGWVLRVRP